MKTVLFNTIVGTQTQPLFPAIEYKGDTTRLRCDVTYYKGILGITDWSITVRVMPSQQVVRDGEGLFGRVEYNKGHRAAVIYIAAYDEAFVDNEHGDSVIKPCMEVTLVHELLHCVLHEDEDEQAVERIARALLIARYGLDITFFDGSKICIEAD